jgi:hypothetical protein
MRTPGIATFGTHGRADAIPTSSREDPSHPSHICYSLALLQHGEPAGRRQIFQEESHQGAFLFSHVAPSRSRLRHKSASLQSNPRCDQLRAYFPLVTWPTKKRNDATELSRNFVPQRPPRFGRYVTNCIDRGHDDA